MGICGGYQMMGVEVCDPDHVEGNIDRLPGLGLLPVSTRLKKEKITRQVTFKMATGHSDSCDDACRGYEIHMGETTIIPDAKAKPFTHIIDGVHASESGCIDNHCFGTYIHGILDNAPVIDFLLKPFIEKASSRTVFDYIAFIEEQYDKLAAHIRQHVNMDLVYKLMKK